MKASKELISDLARKSLNGDRQSFVFLMQILEEVHHPILASVNRGFMGSEILHSVLAPISQLVEGYPKPRVYSQALVWDGSNGGPDNGALPAEIWFEDKYIAYFRNGKRHREGSLPTVIDVASKTIAYYEHGTPRRHNKGPFKVEYDGRATLTYVMDDRMSTRKGYTPLDPEGNVELDPESDGFEEPVAGGDQVIVTRDFIDIEGLGKSPPSQEDLKNLGIWSKELFRWLDWGSSYISDYMNKFK